MFVSRWSLPIILWGCIVSRYQQGYAISRHPIACVMAFDGFRPDYLDRNATPTMRRLSASGVHAEYLKNVFPTKTKVNFFSMATGMHSHKHGVHGNSVFNEKGDCIEAGYEMFHYDDDIVPIWILNELSGGGRHSGVMMWIGGEYEYRNFTPTFYRAYDERMSWIDRVDTIIEWLTHHQTPVNLVYAYFEEPDSSSHQYGTNSAQVTAQLKRIDDIVQYFMNGLSRRDLADHVNVVLLSDHGMVDVSAEHVTDLAKIVDPRGYTMCGGSPVLQLRLTKGFENDVLNNLTRAQNEQPTFDIYTKHEIPDRWHYKGSKRVSDLLLVAKQPYTFADENTKADHGYDNAEPLMHAFFTAVGPLFREKYRIKNLLNIDVYALMAYIMRMDTSKLLVKPDATLTKMLTILKSHAWDDYKNRRQRTILKYFVPRHSGKR